MKKSITVVFGAIAGGVLAQSTPAFSMENDTEKYSTVGFWEIRVDDSLGGGCFMLANYDGGAALRIGWKPKAEELYLIVADEDWDSLQVEKKYDIEMKLGNEAPWNIDASGINVDGLKGLVASVTDENFISEFRNKNSIEFSWNKKPLATLSLKNSKKAFRQLQTCQSGVTDAPEKVKVSGSDAARSDDPFRE